MNNVIKWVDFSIGRGERVAFDAKNYLNYVTGSARSDILGTLSGGGSIYLVNPNGILIGDTASINVGSLYLSTRNLTDDQLAEFSENGAYPAALGSIGGDVINLGRLDANSVAVEGRNITFKNVSDVTKNGTQNTNVTMTATGEIHIGSDDGSPSGYTVTAGDVINYRLVSTPEELQAIHSTSGDISGNYMLKNDIDMSGFGDFTPIGGANENWSFVGRFDGLGYEIKNITISSNSNYVGLFGQTGSTSVIENVGLAGGSVTGTKNEVARIGGIVGLNKGTIRNVWNTATVNGSINDSVPRYTGGIVGYNNGGTIERAYNMGSVTNNKDKGTGGIVGVLYGGTIRQVYNTGTVTNTVSGNVGGIAGVIKSGSTVENAYNTGSVTATEYVGGIVGNNDGTVKNVYNIGTVNGTGTMASIGGLAGRNGGTIASAYTKSGLSSGTGASDTVGFGSGGTAVASDSDLMKKATFSGFNFSENGVWRIYEGKTTPLLAAFLTRKDSITSITEYDGTAEMGATYTPTTYNAEVAQNGYNYINDVSIISPKYIPPTSAENDNTSTDQTAGTARNSSIAPRTAAPAVRIAPSRISRSSEASQATPIAPAFRAEQVPISSDTTPTETINAAIPATSNPSPTLGDLLPETRGSAAGRLPIDALAEAENTASAISAKQTITGNYPTGSAENMGESASPNAANADSPAKPVAVPGGDADSSKQPSLTAVAPLLVPEKAVNIRDSINAETFAAQQIAQQKKAAPDTDTSAETAIQAELSIDAYETRSPGDSTENNENSDTNDDSKEK